MRNVGSEYFSVFGVCVQRIELHENYWDDTSQKVARKKIDIVMVEEDESRSNKSLAAVKSRLDFQRTNPVCAHILFVFDQLFGKPYNEVLWSISLLFGRAARAVGIFGDFFLFATWRCIEVRSSWSVLVPLSIRIADLVNVGVGLRGFYFEDVGLTVNMFPIVLETNFAHRTIEIVSGVEENRLSHFSCT